MVLLLCCVPGCSAYCGRFGMFINYSASSGFHSNPSVVVSHFPTCPSYFPNPDPPPPSLEWWEWGWRRGWGQWEQSVLENLTFSSSFSRSPGKTRLFAEGYAARLTPSLPRRVYVCGFSGLIFAHTTVGLAEHDQMRGGSCVQYTVVENIIHERKLHWP